MTNKDVALVTGANRGIGFEICRQLGQRGLKVVLTARDEDKGATAAAMLRDEDLDVVFHRVDVTNDISISGLEAFLEQEFGRLDVLVNNAGVFIDKDRAGVDVPLEVVRKTVETNTFGALRLAQAVIPLMRRHRFGRIVNVSSQMGQLDSMGGGYPSYRISKAALNAVTRILAAEVKDSGILVNSMCPGWVKTEMGGPNAPRTTEQGADTALWLATLPDDGPTGGFFQDRKPIEW